MFFVCQMHAHAFESVLTPDKLSGWDQQFLWPNFSIACFLCWDRVTGSRSVLLLPKARLKLTVSHFLVYCLNHYSKVALFWCFSDTLSISHCQNSSAFLVIFLEDCYHGTCILLYHFYLWFECFVKMQNNVFQQQSFQEPCLELSFHYFITIFNPVHSKKIMIMITTSTFHPCVERLLK